MYIVLDADKYPLPSQTNIILDAFFLLKEEIERSLGSIKSKTDESKGVIFIIIRPDVGIKIGFLNFSAELEDEINTLFSQYLDLSKISPSIRNVGNN